VGNRGPVAVISENRPEVALCWLAGSRCGLIPSILNPRLTPGELSKLLARLGPVLLVVGSVELDRASEAMDMAGIGVPVVKLGEPARDVTRFEDLMEYGLYRGPHPHREDIFEIAWTSGTTSEPKGVALTHAGVAGHWSAVQRSLGLSQSDVSYVATPLYHQSGLRHTLLVTWLAGGRAHLAPKFSPQTYWDDVVRIGATFTCFVETILHILRLAAPAASEANIPLRLAIGTASPDVRQFVTERLGLKPYFCYGSTETGVPVVGPPDLPASEAQRYEQYRAGARFAGWPTPGCRVKIAGEGDCEQEGVEGEILVQSPGMLRQYWRDPSATRRAFADGWFRSGDQGLRGPDGSIYFLDRLKDLVRRGGENIACREIEDVLMRHPGVARAAVVSVPDGVWTEEAKALVVLRDGVTIEPGTLWGWCKDFLAEFKIPRYIEYRPELPLSTSGKIQKALLRQEGLRSGRYFDRTTFRSEETRS
jgi:acyl-CoA synthetase (AMP-forming)/AMP-acid ligase II